MTHFWIMLIRCLASTKKESSMLTMLFSWWTRASILEIEEKISSAGASFNMAAEPNENTAIKQAAITGSFMLLL